MISSAESLTLSWRIQQAVEECVKPPEVAENQWMRPSSHSNKEVKFAPVVVYLVVIALEVPEPHEFNQIVVVVP